MKPPLARLGSLANNAVVPSESELERLRTDMGALVQQWVTMRIGEAIGELLERHRHVTLSFNGRWQDHAEYTVSVLPLDGVPGASGTAETILGAIRTAQGREQTKQCDKCSKIKKIHQFAKDKGNDVDGHWRYCKECERTRVAGYAKEKRANQKLQAQAFARGQKTSLGGAPSAPDD